jgi:hypothetical protein
MNLEWNVYYENINKRTIEKFNIFSHRSFNEDVKKDLKESNTKEEFEEKFQRNLRYYFWGKCEWEIVLVSWPPCITKEELSKLNQDFKESIKKYNREPCKLFIKHDIGQKIDIHDQVMLNLPILIDMLWRTKNEINK